MSAATDTVKQQKRTLRRQYRAARSALPRAERLRAEREIVRRLKPLIRRGKKTALYWAMGSELNLRPLLHTAAQRGAAVYLPYIEPRKKRMWFTPYREGAAAERKRGRAKLNVPQFAGHRIRADRLDVMVVPVVAADRTGCRLGQAGGYYDATLAECRFRQPLAVAAGFACQLAERLPREAHDILLDGFVSERHKLRFSRR